MNEIFDSQKIIDKYADMIYGVALSHLEDKNDAEDIVQDVFMHYIEFIKHNTFEDEDHEKYWLIRVTINLCNNDNKSARVRKCVSLGECSFLEASRIEDDFIRESLNKLKHKYRIVFELFYLDDLKISEISKILNISEANVKTRLKRARDALRKILELGGEFSGKF